MIDYKLYIDHTGKLRIIEPPSLILRYGLTGINGLYFSNEMEKQEETIHYTLKNNLDILVMALSHINYD